MIKNGILEETGFLLIPQQKDNLYFVRIFTLNPLSQRNSTHSHAGACKKCPYPVSSFYVLSSSIV